MDDRYTIDTPENIEFAYDVAGIGSRFLAAIVDTLLLILLQLALGLVLLLIGSQIETDSRDGPFSLLVAIWALLSFVFIWGYYLFFELIWNGQSPGKRMIGLRVVREGGRPVTFAAAAIRNLVRVIDFLPGFYGLGVLVMFIDQRSRRLGDLVAGSLVVKERRAVTLDSLVARAENRDLQAGAAIPNAAILSTLQLPNLHMLNDNDYNLVQEFLRRRTELGLDSRRRLGAQLAEGLQTRLGLPAGGNAEMFLEHLAQEYRLFKQSDKVAG